ncbi:MAG: FAD-dependent oxidoreductase [Parvularculaceae bacterium]
MGQAVDAVVIGAGVVGLAVARALALQGREVVVLERNASSGAQPSSRTSEVIHAGIYFGPGGLRARLCVEGKVKPSADCGDRAVGRLRCEKRIVAMLPAGSGLTRLNRRALPPVSPSPTASPGSPGHGRFGLAPVVPPRYSAVFSAAG